MKMTLQSG